MQQPLIRILYLSTARPGITEADVEDIVKKASIANQSRGVTGGLAFNGVRFCQCLEGSERDISALLSVIGNDPRHSELTVLAKLNVAARYFVGWEMRWIFDHSFAELRDAMEPHPLPKFA